MAYIPKVFGDNQLIKHVPGRPTAPRGAGRRRGRLRGGAAARGRVRQPHGRHRTRVLRTRRPNRRSGYRRQRAPLRHCGARVHTHVERVRNSFFKYTPNVIKSAIIVFENLNNFFLKRKKFLIFFLLFKGQVRQSASAVTPAGLDTSTRATTPIRTVAIPTPHRL